MTWKPRSAWTEADRETHRVYNREWRKLERERNRSVRVKGAAHYVFSESKLSRDAAALLAELPPDTRTEAQKLMGDPIPARSALKGKSHGS